MAEMTRPDAIRQTAPIRLLIVDDEPDLGRLVAEYFESQNDEVVLAHDLETALSILENDRDLDLCISDIYLNSQASKAGGHRIAEACDERHPRLPVILLTGRPSMSAALEGLRNHAIDFFLKPVDLGRLYERAHRAIEEQRLQNRVRDLEQTNLLLSQLLPNTIEAKDPITRGHSDRVVAYTEGLARRVGVSSADRSSLRLAARLHDIGKIGIPSEILSKPGKLTKDERAVIEEHPEIGHKILEPFAHLPKVRQWVVQHHERWDGRGYPNGLVGDEVALPGRILILAEVYDALATKRSYKDAWPDEKIAALFEEEAGHHFDPDLARIVAEGVRTKGRYFFRDEANEAGSTGSAAGTSEEETGQGSLFA